MCADYRFITRQTYLHYLLAQMENVSFIILQVFEIDHWCKDKQCWRFTTHGWIWLLSVILLVLKPGWRHLPAETIYI